MPKTRVKSIMIWAWCRKITRLHQHERLEIEQQRLTMLTSVRAQIVLTMYGFSPAGLLLINSFRPSLNRDTFLRENKSVKLWEQWKQNNTRYLVFLTQRIDVLEIAQHWFWDDPFLRYLISQKRKGTYPTHYFARSKQSLSLCNGYHRDKICHHSWEYHVTRAKVSRPYLIGLG